MDSRAFPAHGEELECQEEAAPVHVSGKWAGQEPAGCWKRGAPWTGCSLGGFSGCLAS